MRSHGSLSLNRALMAASLVDRLQVTLFPVISGQTGTDAIFQGAADFDLELLESRTLDGGGSATLVHRGHLLNRPYSSEDQPAPESRPVVTALLFDAA